MTQDTSAQPESPDPSQKPCECGCGRPVGPRATGTKGRRAQQPKRFIHGHSRRPKQPVRLCYLDGCERPHKAGGLCGMHYMRRRTHGEVGPSEMLGGAPVPDGLKRCPECNEIKELAGNFYIRASTGRPLPYCRSCVADKNRDRYANAAERRKAWQKNYRAANAEVVRKNDRSRNKKAYAQAKAEGRCVLKYGRGCNEPAGTSGLCETHYAAHRRKALRKYHGEYLASYAERGLTFCWLCCGAFTDDDPPSHDHLLPRSHGGPDELWNIAPAHLMCNVRRQNMPLDETVKAWHPQGLRGPIADVVAAALERVPV